MFKNENYKSAFNLSKVVIEGSLKNYGNVDDSSGILASFIEDYLDIYVKILQKLDVEVWSTRERIHRITGISLSKMNMVFPMPFLI